MKSKVIFFSMAMVLLLCLLVVSGSTGTEDNKQIAVAYTNNVEGYLEPCG